MTMAVCFKCGKIKFGAFVPCPDCRAEPKNEDDLALSLAMTDHYFDMPTLEQMGAAVRDGNPPQLAPETHAQLIDSIRQVEALTKTKEMSPPGKSDAPAAESPPAKTWY